jgi:hypothetical protein
MSKVYIVQVQGWGDSENEFVNVGAFSTKAKAKAHIKTMKAEAVADGADSEDDVVVQIEEMLVD